MAIDFSSTSGRQQRNVIERAVILSKSPPSGRDQHQGTIDVRPSGGAYACHSARLIVGDGRVIENRTIVVDGVKIAQVGAAAAFAHRDFRKQILNVRSDEVLRVAP
jgi:hypothetical protein